MLRKSIAIFMCWFLSGVPLVFAAVRGHKSMYSAGTLTSCKLGEVGTIETSGTAVVFEPDSKGTPVTIPYNTITAIDYGEHAGRRVGSTIALGATTLGIMALPMLFSKKKRHYLTFYFNNDPKIAASQRDELAKNPNAAPKGDVAAFEINKHDYADMISIFQAKTGLKVHEEQEKR